MHAYIFILFLLKWSELPLESRRSDALPDDTVAASKVKDYYIRPDVSVQLPDARKVKNGSSRYILQKTINCHCRDFKSKHLDTKLGRSIFATLTLPNVKPQTKNVLNSCICEMCANIELQLQVLQKLSMAQKRPDIRAVIGKRFTANDCTLCSKPRESYHKTECIE